LRVDAAAPGLNAGTNAMTLFEIAINDRPIDETDLRAGRNHRTLSPNDVLA
jgi:hypothetical protein